MPLSVFRAFFLWSLLFLASLLLSGCFSFPGGASRSGEVQVSRLVPSLSGNLTISGPYDVVLVQGSGLDARMPANVAASLVIEQSAGHTSITPKKNFLLSGQGVSELLVGIDSLSMLDIRTTGKISCTGNLKKSQLVLSLGGTVSGALDLSMTFLDLTVTSPRSIIFWGRVKTLKLQAADLTHLDFRRLEIENKSEINFPRYGAAIKF